MPRIVICPPKLAPKERLNRFGVSRPDNRRTEMPAVRPKRSSGLRRPAPLGMAALEAKARRALARQHAEFEAKDAARVKAEDLPEGLTPCTIPVTDVMAKRAKL